MITNITESNVLIKSFNGLMEQYSINPLEFIVWHALFITCIRNSPSDECIISVSVKEIAKNVNLHGEQIRRSLWKLNDKRLAQKINTQWIYLLDGSIVRHYS